MNEMRAQEIYFSISGKYVNVNSGDSIHEYDFWFKPVDGVTSPRNATVEIFDAAIGSRADVVDHFRNTRTAFQWFKFDDLYVLNHRSLRKKDSELAPIKEKIVFTESEYINTWMPFFTLESFQSPAANGFLMRVKTILGNDVNNFKIRITGEGASDWELVTLNLSIGMVDTSPANSFRIMPLWPDTPPPVFTLSGEEDSIVTLMDAFGEIHPVDQRWTNYKRTVKGIPNSWGVVMSGSALRVNNRVLTGRNEIIPFRFTSKIYHTEPDLRLSVLRNESQSCKGASLKAEGNSRFFNLDKSVWFVENEKYEGKMIEHEFSQFGFLNYDLVVPTTEITLPLYQLETRSIHINPPPVLRYRGYRERIAPGEELIIDAGQSFHPNGHDLKFSWYVNDDLKSTRPIYRFTSFTPGTHTIRLVIEDTQQPSACGRVEKDLVVTINTAPFAEINFRNVIAPNTRVQASVYNERNATSHDFIYTWSGSGIVGGRSGKTVEILHTEPGAYSLTLSIDDGFGTLNSVFTTTFDYRVNAGPQPFFTTPEIVAPFQNIVLSAQNTPEAQRLMFTWQLSDGRSLSGENNTVIFESPGSYTIELIADDQEELPNSKSSLTRTILVNSPPNAVIRAPEITNNPIVQFDGSSSHDYDQSIVSYLWDFGDGSLGRGAEVAHTYASHGTFMVTLTVDDGTNVANSKNTSQHTVRINKNPIAIIEAPERAALGVDVVFDGRKSNDIDGEITAFEWYHNGSLIGVEPVLVKKFDQPGVHYITLNVRDNSPFENAIGSTFTKIEINPTMAIDLSKVPQTTAPNELTVFDISNSFDLKNNAAQVIWSFSDGTVLHGTTVERSFPNEGSISYNVQVNDGKALENSITVKESSIRVNAPPILVTDSEIRSNTRLVRLDASQSYDPEGNQLQFKWILPDGNIRSEASFNWVAPEYGVHIVVLEINDGEGLSNSVVSTRVPVMINRPPVAVLQDQINSCTGQIVLFSSSESYDPDGDGFTTFWKFGDGNTSNLANPIHRFEKPGIYTAQLFLNDGFSEHPTVGEVPVIIEGAPQARIREKTYSVCANTQIVFDGSDSTDPNNRMGSYSWDFGDGNSGVGAITPHIFTEPGEYRVTLTITGSGTGTCPNTSQDTAIVTVVKAPTASFSIPEVVSPGTEIYLNNTESVSDDPIIETRWMIKKNDETFLELTGHYLSFKPDVPAQYNITMYITTANQAGCSQSSSTQTLKVNKAPVIVWNVPNEWYQYEPFMLNALGSYDEDGFIDEYIWRVDGKEISRGIAAILPVTEARNIEIELEIRDNSGIDNSVRHKRKTVSIAPALIPDFELPDYVYKHSEVSLSPKWYHSFDGKSISTTWLVNGETLTNPQFTAKATSYTVTLIQDYSSATGNQSREKTKVLQVIQPKTLNLSIPERMISGIRLDGSEIHLPDDYSFIINGSISNTWYAATPGKQTIEIGWVPDGRVRETHTFEIQILEPLKADLNELYQEAIFNPLNSIVKITAPSINRPHNSEIIYRWVDENGAIVATSKTAFIPVKKGRNIFELHISDASGTFGSQSLQIPVVIRVND